LLEPLTLLAHKTVPDGLILMIKISRVPGIPELIKLKEPKLTVSP